MRKLGLSRLTVLAALALFAALVSSVISGCSLKSPMSVGGGGGGGGSSSNQLAISVNTGPALNAGTLDVNSAFTSVTICVPGSTTQCQTIGGILVDTGSAGFRVLSSALTLSLPQQKDSGGNAIGECTIFVSSETWGPVETADITMAGEKASSQSVQVIGGGSGSVGTPPTSCSNQGPVFDTLGGLGANGILGIGNLIQDCPGCAPGTTSNPGFYYSCSSICNVTTLALASQVSNPVAAFAKDNNGVIVQLPAAAGPQASLSGSLIFGIGTESNNGLGSVTVYNLDPNTGNFNTTLNGGATFTDAAFLDTGSNGIYFPDSSLPVCTGNFSSWYCPTSTQTFMATNQAFPAGATTTINFSVDNAQTLLSNQNDAVAPTLAGPNSGAFDWGLPFFYGRNVYVAIEGASTPGGSGPYVAY